eukprot:1089246-Rhodomonas_salina.1
MPRLSEMIAVNVSSAPCFPGTLVRAVSTTHPVPHKRRWYECFRTTYGLLVPAIPHHSTVSV